MAFESKLEVHKLYLQSEKNPSFQKLFSNSIVEDDTVVFLDLFSKFIKEIDQEKYHTIDKKKKAFTAYDTKKTETSEPSINVHSEKFIIEGYIEGGKFGKKRSKSDLDAKKNKDAINEKGIILDKYYFCIYAPLDSKTAIVIIHSYSSDSVTEVFLDFLKDFFSSETKGYKKCKTEKFFPKKIIEDFNKNSSIKSFTFSTSLVVGTLEENELIPEKHEFAVKIEAKSSSKIDKSSFEKWLSTLSKGILLFGGKRKQIGEFERGSVQLSNQETGKTTSFEISKKFEIKPVIYLDNKKIKFEEDGSPNFESLKKFCFKLLEEIKQEAYPLYGR